MDLSDLPRPPPEASRTLHASGLRQGRPFAGADCVAEERPVALEYNGISHAVMLATPADLEDFAYGFTLTEGLVDGLAQIHDCGLVPSADGWTVQVTIASSCFARLKERRRNLTGRTGCGLCGTESLAQAVRPPVPLRMEGEPFAAAAVARAMAGRQSRQWLGAATGATHAAAWCQAGGEIVLLREDVGRHNALDKLVGALQRARLPAAEGFIVVTSRASYEMVHKAAGAGVGLLAAISGVTGLAVDSAQASGLTLAGFARGQDISIYSHPARLALNTHFT